MSTANPPTPEFPDFPNEIISLIVGFLHEMDLKSKPFPHICWPCSLVNRDWRYIAQPCIFSFVKLAGACDIANFLSVLLTSPHLAAFIQTLHISSTSPIPYDRIVHLLALLPAVTVLSLGSNPRMIVRPGNQLFPRETLPLFVFDQPIFNALHHLSLESIQNVPFDLISSRCPCLCSLAIDCSTASRQSSVGTGESGRSSRLTKLHIIYQQRMDQLFHPDSSFSTSILQGGISIADITFESIREQNHPLFFLEVRKHFGRSLQSLNVNILSRNGREFPLLSSSLSS